MSTTGKQILDIYQMSVDAGIGEDEIRSTLDLKHIVLVTTDPNIELTKARQARNAYHNLLWFFKTQRTGHTMAQMNELETAVLNRWKELSLDELIETRTKEAALQVYNEAHEDIRQSTVAMTRLLRHYKILQLSVQS